MTEHNVAFEMEEIEGEIEEQQTPLFQPPPAEDTHVVSEDKRIVIQEWMEKLAKIKREEFEGEEATHIPIRHYLMSHVIPALTKGLTEVVRIRPENPADFLAEYLFQFAGTTCAVPPSSDIDGGDHQTKSDVKAEHAVAVMERENEEMSERQKSIEQWMEEMAIHKQEEYEREEAALLPIRQYLMSQVMPTLAKAIVEVTRARPENPIDFLAEFLFTNNPNGLNPVGDKYCKE